MRLRKMLLVLISTLTFATASCSNQGEPTYTVTLRGNGGTPISQTVSAQYGEPMPSARKPTRFNYTFIGYYDSMYQMSGTKYYDSSMRSVRNYDYNSNATLYAIWQ